jgi:acyl-CoA thioesterase I
MRVNSKRFVSFATCGLFLQLSFAHAATVVALGASNTAGKGVSPSQAYPAQLEIMLRARGFDVNVINAGVSGDTTGGMMARLESAVPKGTSVVILQPGGNDLRKGAPNYTAELRSRLSAMGVKVIMLPKGMFSRQAAPARWDTPYPGRLPSARAATGRPGCQYAKKVAQTVSDWLLTMDLSLRRSGEKAASQVAVTNGIYAIGPSAISRIEKGRSCPPPHRAVPRELRACRLAVGLVERWECCLGLPSRLVISLAYRAHRSRGWAHSPAERDQRKLRGC